MKVSTEAVATREVMLTVEPDPQTIQRAMRKAGRQISRWRPVAGYRPGKAPYGIVERLYGREMILNEALNNIAPELYREAVAEADVQPYEQGLFDLDSDDPVVLKMQLPLMPKVTLGDYSELAIEPEPEVTISEEQIDEQVEALQRQQAEYEPVERPIEMGDQATASVSGHADGEQVLTQENATLNVSEEMMPPGFAEAIMGARTDDTREFSLAYPEDFDNEELAGKMVSFEVTIKTIRQVNLPEIDDDLAKAAGDYETLTELRDGIAENLKRRLENEARSHETHQAVETLVEISEVEYPQIALDREVESAIDQQKSRLQQMGFTFDAYLRMISQTEEDLREQMLPEARHQLVERLVLSEFAQAEELSLDNDEMQAEFTAFANSMYATHGTRAESMIEEMQKSGALLSIYSTGVVRKAARLLTNRLTGREEEPVTEETPADAAETPAEEAPKAE